MPRAAELGAPWFARLSYYLVIHATRSRSSTLLSLARLVFDIAAPVALYYLLRGEGASYAVALLAGAALPAIGAAVSLARDGRADPVAVVMVVALAASVVGSLITGDPRFLLAKDGVITGMWGVWFLASVRARRPAALVFAQPLMEGASLLGTRSWDGLWVTEPRFRRIWRVASVLWGVGLLVDAAIRVTISYALPIDDVPGIGAALYPATFVVLQVITNVYYTRAGLYELLGARWAGRRFRARRSDVPEYSRADG